MSNNDTPEVPPEYAAEHPTGVANTYVETSSAPQQPVQPQQTSEPAPAPAPEPIQDVHDAPDMSQEHAPQPVETHTIVKSRTRKLPIFVAGLLGTLVGAALVIALVMSGAFGTTSSDSAITYEPGGETIINVSEEDVSLAEGVAIKTLPSVVSISASMPEGYSEGTGVVIDGDGNIITNHHVISGADAIVVTMDSVDYEATLVGEDPTSDLAVINVDCPADKLVPIEIGDSDSLVVGEWVMALGNPFGNQQSVSSGIVSSLNRSSAVQDESGLAIYVNLIQTDAAINPGNSGGALVNKHGELIGINSLIESYSGSSSGVGFAIPSNYAMDIANQIIAGDVPVHPYLGVVVTSVNPFSAEYLGVDEYSGAYVKDVSAGGPAQLAGLQPGDVIIAIDDKPIDTSDALIIMVRSHQVGDTITMTVIRDGEEMQLEATLTTDEALRESTVDEAEPNDSDVSEPMTDDELFEYFKWLFENRER